MAQKGFLMDVGDHIRMDYMRGIAVMPYTHLHPQYELYFCPENVEQRSVINGQEYRYCYPCVIISRPYTVHSMSCMQTSGTEYERFVFYFNENTLSRLGSGLLPEKWGDTHTGLMFRLTEEQGKYLQDFLKSTISDGEKLTVCEKELIFGFLVNRLYRFCTDDAIMKVDTTHLYIQDVMCYVAEHLSEENDIGMLAEKFAVSRSKLDRDFKVRTGMTVHKFVDVCRLNLAKMMLRKTEHVPVAEICDACGFQNETYFYLFFKKNTGLSPMQFRKETSEKGIDAVYRKF